jgi:hypothetical protein
MNSQCSGGFIFIDRDEEWLFGSRVKTRTPDLAIMQSIINTCYYELNFKTSFEIKACWAYFGQADKEISSPIKVSTQRKIS